ncbi:MULTISPECIES: hypothetical protein [Rhodobacterales]|uniref:helix-turn-helix transcriptional regulator n=1 Tax=Rhodobacterales TaxID=204455 RepID=UPI003297505C
MIHTVSAEKTRQLLTTIDALYDAVCNPENWETFLAASSHLFEAQGAQIGHHDLANHQLSFSRLHGYAWDQDHYRRYDELMPEDPRLAHFSSNPFVPIHCRMSVSDETLHASRIYQEVLAPGGVEYSLGVNLREEDQSLSYFLALRNRHQNRFGETECALLQELIPHLNRALWLKRDLATIDFERNIAADTLDVMAIGIIVVDRSSAIRFANHTAREILHDRDGIFREHDKIHVSSDPGNSLKSCIARVLHKAQIGAACGGEAIALNRPSDGEKLAVFVSSVLVDNQQPGWAQVAEPLALLVLRDPRRPVETENEVLCRVFGLTPTQSRLAGFMVQGLTVREAAGEAGITEASARQYLKIVFQKMNVTRQSEMMMKMLELPAPRKSALPSMADGVRINGKPEGY